MINYKNLQDQLAVGSQVKSALRSYDKAVKSSTCDKYGMGFNKDDRFSSAKIGLTIDGWTGYYGSSSCSSVSIVRDQKVFKKFFLIVLNKRFRELLIETADEIIKDAEKHKVLAIKELKDALAILEGEDEKNIK